MRESISHRDVLSGMDQLKLILSDNAAGAICELSSWAMIASAVLIFVSTLYIKAPYGRYSSESKGWGPLVEARLAWIMMECPNIIIVIGILYYAYVIKHASIPLSNLVLLGLFCLHYFQRSVIYPLRMEKGQGSSMPVSVMMMGNLYVSWNSLTQAVYLVCVKRYE
jgi:hypothetical protein